MSTSIRMIALLVTCFLAFANHRAEGQQSGAGIHARLTAHGIDALKNVVWFRVRQQLISCLRLNDDITWTFDGPVYSYNINKIQLEVDAPLSARIFRLQTDGSDQLDFGVDGVKIGVFAEYQKKDPKGLQTGRLYATVRRVSTTFKLNLTDPLLWHTLSCVAEFRRMNVMFEHGEKLMNTGFDYRSFMASDLKLTLRKQLCTTLTQIIASIVTEIASGVNTASPVLGLITAHYEPVAVPKIQNNMLSIRLAGYYSAVSISATRLSQLPDLTAQETLLTSSKDFSIQISQYFFKTFGDAIHQVGELRQAVNNEVLQKSNVDNYTSVYCSGSNIKCIGNDLPQLKKQTLPLNSVIVTFVRSSHLEFLISKEGFTVDFHVVLKLTGQPTHFLAPQEIATFQVSLAANVSDLYVENDRLKAKSVSLQQPLFQVVESNDENNIQVTEFHLQQLWDNAMKRHVEEYVQSLKTVGLPLPISTSLEIVQSEVALGNRYLVVAGKFQQQPANTAGYSSYRPTFCRSKTPGNYANPIANNTCSASYYICSVNTNLPANTASCAENQAYSRCTRSCEPKGYIPSCGTDMVPIGPSEDVVLLRNV